ncbi:pyocin knob domain-containing protein [Levilactobacillus brevis]|uniref:pyocin knob domain-containing protein n=1 Tax=Levilactobacillus brevis TaxID=1580 RepID=UPI00325A9BFC
MATPNVGILTTAGKALIDKVNSGQAKISFSKIVFSSMDNSQLSDMQVKALTAIAPQEVVVSSPETTLDTNSGETRIRATGTNEKLADGVYVKTYGVFAKDDTGSEILYGVTVSPNPNYFPAYDGVTPQAVTYSYKTVIQETSNITMTNSNDMYASQEDLTEALQPYAKTVDVNQQLDKKVNIADMRKPASDVAGIEEVNAKQDKIGYTPADDSKVVHDNHDNTITANNLNYDLSKTGITPLGVYKSGSFNDLPLGTVFTDPPMTDGPDTIHSFTTTTFLSSEWGGRKAQIAITDNTNLMYFRVYAGVSWNSWTLLSDDSKVVHSTDMRKPANNVAGIEEVNAKQDKIGYTPADDSKVAHLSGANNFDTVPTVNNNPLLLASSLPSDLARTSQQTNFTAGLKSGGVDVATAADLNNYYHANASDGAALAAAKAAKVPGIFWFEEV